MALLDDINRLLRDHTGYTGDGQGSNGPLPVGDRSTARYMPNMRDLRELMKTIAQTLGDPGALQDILANSGKVFANRADAVSAGQSALTGVLGRIATIEADHLVYRAPYQNGDDPLFDTAPYWGATDRFPRKSYVDNRDALRSAAIRDSGALRLTNIGGTGDAITADLHPVMVDAGITDLSTSSEIEFVPVATNAAVNPSFTVAGVAYQIRNSDGGTWPANGFAVGRSYTLRRRNNVLRVASGDVTATELAKLVDRAGIQKLENVSGTENAISAAMPSGGSPATGVRVLLTPLVANTGDVTLSIDGGPAVQIRGMDGQQVPPGGLRPAQSILIERMSSPSVWQIVMDNLSKSYVDGRIQETQTDLRADVALVADQTAAVVAEIAAPFISVVGSDFTVMETDADGNAIRVMRPDGQDMIMSKDFWDRAPNLGGGSVPGEGGISTTEWQAISANGQSLSVGGPWSGSQVTRDEFYSKVNSAHALMLLGTVRGDGAGIVSVDAPRSGGYDKTKPATGVGIANSSTSIVTAAIPLAFGVNMYRGEIGLPVVPVLTQCHGVAGIRIEDLDQYTDTGTGNTVPWENIVFWYQQVILQAAANDKKLSVPWHDWVHGTSAQADPAGQYEAALWRYQNDLRALLADLGAQGPARFIMSQAGGNTNTSAVAWHVVNEQLAFCEAGGGVMATPEYAYQIADNNVHPDAFWTIQFQEVKARAIAEIEAGRLWTIHRPKVSRSDNRLVLDFDSLRPDEYLVLHDPARYGGQGIDQFAGFEAVGANITGMQVRGRQVILDCDAAPAGVKYAYQRQDVRGFADNKWNAHRGLLRTSEVWASKLLTGVDLYRWVPSFSISF